MPAEQRRGHNASTWWLAQGVNQVPEGTARLSAREQAVLARIHYLRSSEGRA